MRMHRLKIRFLPAWALSAGSAIWMGAVALSLVGAPSAFAASKNEPAALPLVDVQAQWAAELPKVLSPTDAVLYRDIFAAQAANNWAAADRGVPRVKDRRLGGHLLAQRYLNTTGWHATYDELAAWLKNYADHPQAPAIYQMALHRAPKRHATALRRPTFENLRAGWFVPGEDTEPDAEADMTPPDQPDEGSENADPPSPPGPKLDGAIRGQARGVKRQVQQRLRLDHLVASANLPRTRNAT